MANEKLKQLRAMQQDHILETEELDQIAGGYTTEMSEDSKFLTELLKGRGPTPGRWSEYGLSNGDCFLQKRLIDEAWKSVGIDANVSPGMSNKYYLDGKRITRAEAWAHAEKVIGRHLERKDWDW